MSHIQAKVIVKRGKTLALTFNINAQNPNVKSSVSSEEYHIKNAVRVKIRFSSSHQECSVFATFTKMYEKDFKYALNIFSEDLALNDKTYYTDYSEQYLGTRSGGQSFQIGIQIDIDLAPRANQFEALYDDTDLTDFELRTEDGSVSFHKVVLAYWSPVFKTMFSSKWKETNVGLTELKGVSRVTAQQLKEYLYLQVLPDGGLEQLLQLASCYLIPELKQRCVDRLLSSLTAHNAWQLVEFAVSQDMPYLFGELLLHLDQELIQEICKHYTLSSRNASI